MKYRHYKGQLYLSEEVVKVIINETVYRHLLAEVIGIMIDALCPQRSTIVHKIKEGYLNAVPR